jgi:N,N'-diacetyllegionaminate synthase
MSGRIVAEHRSMRPQVIKIEGRDVGVGQPCFIIAEIGVNHNGDVNLAHKMVDAIAESGADCVKFQTFHAEEFCNDRSAIYEYVSQGRAVRESMLEMFKRLQLQDGEHHALFAHARDRGLVPLSTPTDAAAVYLLAGLGIGAYKVGSDDLVYTDFIDLVARQGKPMIISTGMADADDVLRAINVIDAVGNNEIIFLHCVSEYPTSDASVNMRKIEALRALTGYPIGFSDHSWGITAPLGAVALGACVIEKHFTLDRNMAGPDHRFSCDPKELGDLVCEIRRMEAQLGSADIRPTPAEVEMRKLCRRSIVAARDLSSGTVIAEADLTYQRPGTGLLPYEAPRLIGRRLSGSIPKGYIFNGSSDPIL